MRLLMTLLTPLLTTALALGAACASEPPPAPTGPEQAPPLTAAQQEIFLGSPEDPVPEKLNATRKDLEGRHYLMGDEINLDLFYKTIKGIRGGYMGVGSDQAYLFAGWMRAEYVWLTDYDPWIKWLHRSYVAFFTQAATFDEFVELWNPKKSKAGRKLLGVFYADHPERKKVIFVYRNAAHKVYRRLRRLQRHMKKKGVPTFVTDAETYDYVRGLVMGGRVRPMVCNLLADRCLIGIGEASRKLGTPVRVLYPSNAEEYWPYRKQFKANIQALNFDDASVILRTGSAKAKGLKGTGRWNGDYHYNVQPGNNFKEWLAQPHIRRVRQIAPKRRLKSTDEIPFFVTKGAPPEPKKKKKKRRR